uniref:uncharacterized protein LOC120326625 n=1 Tax=Styela clava TaxID=7725 RepID=UPI00193946C6|nr:uncharacterized protein LOC120326625 [Styela clava]
MLHIGYQSARLPEQIYPNTRESEVASTTTEFGNTQNGVPRLVEEGVENEGRVSEQCPAVNEAEPIRNPADLEKRREQINDDKDPPEPSQPLPPRQPNLQISGGNYNQTAIMSAYTSYNSTSGSIQDGPNQQNPNDN